MWSLLKAVYNAFIKMNDKLSVNLFAIVLFFYILLL